MGRQPERLWRHFSNMDYAYTTRPLTSDEVALARLWTQTGVFMAGLQLLVMRLEEPKLTIEQVEEMHPLERRAYLYGLLENIERDVKLHIAAGKLSRMDPQKVRQH